MAGIVVQRRASSSRSQYRFPESGGDREVVDATAKSAVTSGCGLPVIWDLKLESSVSRFTSSIVSSTSTYSVSEKWFSVFSFCNFRPT